MKGREEDMLKNQPNTNTLQELQAEELTAVVGGRNYNIYSHGGSYSGANVHSFKKSSKKKR
jgi:hypothetical protein